MKIKLTSVLLPLALAGRRYVQAQTAPIAVASFTLGNADTDADIGP